MQDGNRLTRRRLVTLTGAGAAVALAGCTGDGGDGSDSGDGSRDGNTSGGGGSTGEGGDSTSTPTAGFESLTVGKTAIQVTPTNPDEISEVQLLKDGQAVTSGSISGAESKVSLQIVSTQYQPELEVSPGDYTVALLSGGEVVAEQSLSLEQGIEIEDVAPTKNKYSSSDGSKEGEFDAASNVIITLRNSGSMPVILSYGTVSGPYGDNFGTKPNSPDSLMGDPIISAGLSSVIGNGEKEDYYAVAPGKTVKLATHFNPLTKDGGVGQTESKGACTGGKETEATLWVRSRSGNVSIDQPLKILLKGNYAREDYDSIACTEAIINMR